MDFLKKHYEKVLLGVVLLGLAVAVAFLPFKITSEKQRLEDMRNTLIHPKVKPLPPLDLALPDALLKRVATPVMIDFSAPNKLFNPMPWEKAADGHLIKVDTGNIGPNALTITELTPLYLTLKLKNVTVIDSVARCRIGIENEATVNLRNRIQEKYCRPGDKNETFALREVKGALNDPTNLVAVLELNDTKQRVELSQQQPFRRIDGYMADLKYAPENMTSRDRRVGAVLHFNGEDYNIVAITENEVVLSAKSNQKKWTVRYNPSVAH